VYAGLKQQLVDTLAQIKAAGLYKEEREISSPQSAHIRTAGRDVLNFCANNYLGLADHPDIEAAAKQAIDEWGFGLASVRFICGTQTLHKDLEREVSSFLGTEDTILYSSCFDANGGVFETLFDAEDAIISDELNHASIIDGMRLSKAQRFRYRNRDMADLKAQLEGAVGARHRAVVTDGVFSMDGYFAPLAEICDLADEYGSLVIVDDSHAVGFIGAGGRGTGERAGVRDRIDVYTGTFGKALGGASGGYVTGRAEIVELLRQRSRPYLFSNTLAPAVVSGNRAALRLVRDSDHRRENLERNSASFRAKMGEAEFELLPGEHPIVPVMFHDAGLAADTARLMLQRGVYVTAFSYPVVPTGLARIRVQLSASHSLADIDTCVAAFVAARSELG
jgi:glycine C-acetyltransferase